MRYETFALASLIFVGCASHVWRHPDHNDQARFNRDAYECERDMRQSGYYGGGLVGAINAQGFGERCMIARGYYKAPIESQQTSAPVAVPPPSSIAQGAYQAVALAQQQPAPQPQQAAAQAAPASKPSSAAPRYAQLYHVRGKIVSTPPQTFTAEFFDDGKAKVELSGRRVLLGDFELFPMSVSLASKLRLVRAESIKAVSGADTKGIARLTDVGVELECAYTIISSTGRGAGMCSDNQGNGYEIAF